MLAERGCPQPQQIRMQHGAFKVAERTSRGWPLRLRPAVLRCSAPSLKRLQYGAELACLAMFFGVHGVQPWHDSNELGF